jgi:hypothetical protein
LEYPINLKIDFYNNRLYWLDYKLKKIESISIASKNHQLTDRRSVYRFNEYFQPKQFDLFDDFIYIIGRTSQKSNKIIIIHKFNKPILRDDFFETSLREKVFNFNDFKPESLEFTTILSQIFFMNPLKQPNETFIYMSKLYSYSTFLFSIFFNLDNPCKVNKCSPDEVCVYVDDLVKSICVKLINIQTKSSFEKKCSSSCLDSKEQCCSNRGSCLLNDTNYNYICSCNLSYSGNLNVDVHVRSNFNNL